MNRKFVIGLLAVLALIIVACTPTEEENIESPTPDVSQTPLIQVVTATPSFTPIVSPTLPATPTALPSPTSVPTQSILDRCVLRTDWEVYTVQVGDNLSNIAVRTESTITALQLANCIQDVNIITVGQELYVPQLPDPAEVIVEDIISNFSVTVEEAEAGDAITFSWEAEDDTVIEITYVTDDILIGANLEATGTLSFTLPADLEVGDELEFKINGSKTDGNDEILASPYSVFVTIIELPEATEEATEEVTEEPEATEEVTDEPEATEEVTDEPEATEEVTDEPEATEEA